MDYLFKIITSKAFYDLIVVIGSFCSIVVPIWMLLKSFKADFEKRFDLIDKRFESIDREFDLIDRRFESFENKITAIENRLFWFATGKRIEDAILEERLKKDIK